MKYSLFGNNISPDCSYCHNMVDNICVKKKIIKNGKCRKFSYNPLLRVPKVEPNMMKFSREEFEL